ncbi:hypothetical protein A6E15_07575 [Natrinema saccharevitans]|uniref:Uncharacterized protein n=1 Tax=Natrinema saccharevitans TaxID=301967 RepID=A0A1S8AVA7_9EURY|nr:hypothetical protein [Natrinema saccharevitans]OLZ40858.1 hypothetical protein A6E15_07575 [Natrinema saccharevitans]
MLRQDYWLLFSVLLSIFYVLLIRVAYTSSETIGTDYLLTGSITSMFWAGFGGLFLFILILNVWSGVNEESNVTNNSHYLTIRTVPDLVLAHVISSSVKFLAVVTPITVAAGIGFSVGSESYQNVIGFVVLTPVLVVSAVAAGYPLGLIIKGIVRRSQTLLRYKSLIGLLLTGLYFGTAVTGYWDAIIETGEPALTAPPLTWFGDLALVTVAGEGATPITAPLLTGFFGLLTAIAIGCAIPAARFAWSGDLVITADDSESDDDSLPPDHQFETALARICTSQGTFAIASTTLIRLVRSPKQIVFVALPLLGVIPAAEQFLTTGSLPWYAPWAVVWYGAWTAGTAISLNPLGNQGATLPAVLSSPISGRQIVHGYIVAVLTAAPITVLFAIGTGIVADRPQSELAVLAVASVVAIAIGAVVSIGIGTLFPRFQESEIGQSTVAVPPSKTAYLFYSLFSMAIVIAVATINSEMVLEITTSLITRLLPLAITVSNDIVEITSWAMIVAIVLSVPIWYRIAVDRLHTYELE